MIKELLPDPDAAVDFGEEAYMDLKQLAEWVEARICAPCKQGYTCDDFDCDQAKKIAEILRRMVPFKGRDDHGKDVSGWLVPD
jgi:hypothetical protein